MSRPGTRTLVYTAGLDRVEEAVISARCMRDLARDPRLELYDDEEFTARAVTVTPAVVHQVLLPGLLRSSAAFCRDRAAAGAGRARERHRAYGLSDPGAVGAAERITEIMFDPQFQRAPGQTCSRGLIRDRVAGRLRAGRPIEMVIPALPFKFSSPLRTRGRSPDLADLNFLLELYEIAATIELVYRDARPDLHGRLAHFTVVSDGSRFNRIVHEGDPVVDRYRDHLRRWVRRLGLDTYVTLVDYHALLRDRLPRPARDGKEAIRAAARARYGETLWPVFDPRRPAAMLRAATAVEPDPESANPDGRFVSLVKSLVYTINYRSLDHLRGLSPAAFRARYRQLTAGLFEPCAGAVTESLRQAMLREVWATAIDYLAEIKSDRELPEDPILTCLPDRFRWTIHAKAGQLAIATATANGTRVPAWAGVPIFKPTGRRRVKLCTLAVLAAEGAGATPVIVDGDDQPFFYVHPDVAHAGIEDFLAGLSGSLTRRRVTG